jgi:hypothetical protein
VTDSDNLPDALSVPAGSTAPSPGTVPSTGTVIGLDIGGTKTRGVRFEDGQPVAH